MRSFFLTVIATFTLHVFAQEGPGLGVEVSVSEIATWDISIGPDGAGLPEGSGTAEEGAAI